MSRRNKFLHEYYFLKRGFHKKKMYNDEIQVSINKKRKQHSREPLLNNKNRLPTRIHHLNFQEYRNKEIYIIQTNIYKYIFYYY